MLVFLNNCLKMQELLGMFTIEDIVRLVLLTPQTNPTNLTNPTNPTTCLIANALAIRPFSLIDTAGTQSDGQFLFINLTPNGSLVIYEMMEYKNMWTIYPHTITMDAAEIKHTVEQIVSHLLGWLQQQYQDERLLKCIDFKILIYLPAQDISQL